MDPDPNPDPKFPEKSDPNPEPKKITSDPQHWFRLYTLRYTCCVQVHGSHPVGQGHQGGPVHRQDAAEPPGQDQARLPLTGDPCGHLE